jgi:hypothetical protein
MPGIALHSNVHGPVFHKSPAFPQGPGKEIRKIVKGRLVGSPGEDLLKFMIVYQIKTGEPRLLQECFGAIDKMQFLIQEEHYFLGVFQEEAEIFFLLGFFTDNGGLKLVLGGNVHF